MKTIDIKDAMKLKRKSIFVDVRSPKEFAEASIPGAINIPIFDNLERSEVGIAYKQLSKDEAVNLGMKYVSPKLEAITKEMMALTHKYENVFVYCWRGGMRSGAICNLISSVTDKNVCQVIGGIKAYRQYVMDYNEKIEEKKKFIVLHGLTGVGKTRLLLGLKERGYSIIDLEGVAENAGSVFGNVLYPKAQPSQKNFDSSLFEDCYYAEHDFIFIESESKRIGSINVPDGYMNSIRNGHHILVETNMENRIENLIGDYRTNIDSEMIIKCLKNLNRRLSNARVEELIDLLNDNKIDELVEILLLEYYDPLYQFSIEKYEPYEYSINYKTIDGAVDEIEKIYGLIDNSSN